MTEIMEQDGVDLSVALAIFNTERKRAGTPDAVDRSLREARARCKARREREQEPQSEPRAPGDSGAEAPTAAPVDADWWTEDSTQWGAEAFRRETDTETQGEQR